MASSTQLNRFLKTFVLPLVAGGRLEVSGVYGPGVLASFVDDRLVDATLLAEVTRHVRAHLARVGPVGSVDTLPPDAVALAAVWHNLLAMTHPEVSPRASVRKTVREWCDKMLEWIGPPRTATEVALRHGVLAQLGDVGRVDTDVTFWAGSAKYIGVAPPARLVAWKSVRRVQEVKTRVALFDLLASLRSDAPQGDLTETTRLALALSPLTDLALLDRPGPAAFQWTAALVNALADPALRGAATRIVLARAPELAPEKATEAAAARVKHLEHATLAAVHAGAPAPAARVMLTLHVELLAAEALGRAAPPPSGHLLAWDAVARLGPERAAAVVALPFERFERALGLDRANREPIKEAPAAPLLARAGYVEGT